VEDKTTIEEEEVAETSITTTTGEDSLFLLLLHIPTINSPLQDHHAKSTTKWGTLLLTVITEWILPSKANIHQQSWLPWHSHPMLHLQTAGFWT
jgi:hypothetical protein